MKTIFRFRLVGLLVLVGFAVSVTSCNTMRGVGRDVKKAGNKIERAAS